jgi:hypothetical protein
LASDLQPLHPGTAGQVEFISNQVGNTAQTLPTMIFFLNAPRIAAAFPLTRSHVAMLEHQQLRAQGRAIEHRLIIAQHGNHKALGIEMLATPMPALFYA